MSNTAKAVFSTVRLCQTWLCLTRALELCFGTDKLYLTQLCCVDTAVSEHGWVPCVTGGGFCVRYGGLGGSGAVFLLDLA